MINVAVLGYGTIGSGVVEIFDRNGEVLAKRIGDQAQVKYILDLRDFPGNPHEAQLTKDFKQIVNDPEVDIVVECMGGLHPAYDFVKEALLAGKSVTTSNKAIVAAFGPELVQIAKDKNINFMFEASVGGGIPIIRPIRTCLSSDVVDEITGILNGTTNYMLTKMAREGSAYEDVLKEAQARGYAEKDPTADVEGHDAGRKIAILTSLIAEKNVNYEDVHMEGITNLEPIDFKYAELLERNIKLLASSHKVGDTYYAMVAPCMIGAEHPLGHVNDVYNGVFVHGDVIDDLMFYGSGAGKLPTASAIVTDIVEMAQHLHDNLTVNWDSESLVLADYKKASHQYFVRIEGCDEAAVKSVFVNARILTLADLSGEFAFVTEEMPEEEYDRKAAALTGIKKMIRLA